nr:hypothetical protein [Clostridioides sp. ES-S-0107-01]
MLRLISSRFINPNKIVNKKHSLNTKDIDNIKDISIFISLSRDFK